MKKAVHHINILDHWKRHFDALSSPFSIRPALDRGQVDFVYETLADFWGKDFFQTSLLDALHENRAHFLFTLLGESSPSSFYYLREVCTLVSYARDKLPSLFASLHSVRFLSDPSKETLFEIYVALTFARNNIPYVANVLVGKQWKDGYCLIDGQAYLVECKKKYSVLSEEIKIRKLVMTEILKSIKAANSGLECIGVINVKTTVYNSQSFKPVMKQFKNYLATRTDPSPNYLIEDGNISLEIKPLNDANRIELENRLVPYTIYFTVNDMFLIQGNTSQFRILLYFNAEPDGKKIAAKLISTLKKARDQHRTDTSYRRIFFVDNEFLNDFSTPLLNGSHRYEAIVQDYINSKQTEDTVVLLYRNFTSKMPSVRATVICKDQLSSARNALENLSY